MTCVFGVDLGGTYVRAAAADLASRIVAERAEPVTDLTPHGFRAQVRELVGELCPTDPVAVAVGLPGPVRRDGSAGPVVNAPGLNGAPIKALLEEQLDATVIVENDVNLATLGEQRQGCARGLADVAFIAVGTGIGMGIVVDGGILRGAHGGAGELGLLPLAPDRVATDLSALGPLEAVAGGAGMAARWSRHTGTAASARDVFAAAERADAAAIALLDDQAAALAMAMRGVQALLDPELIVLGGGMGARHDVFTRIKAALAEHGTPSPRLQRSELGERAGMVGALQAALDAASDTELAGARG